LSERDVEQSPAHVNLTCQRQRQRLRTVVKPLGMHTVEYLSHCKRLLDFIFGLLYKKKINIILQSP